MLSLAIKGHQSIVHGALLFDPFRNEEMMICRVIESGFADYLELAKTYWYNCVAPSYY